MNKAEIGLPTLAGGNFRSGEHRLPADLYLFYPWFSTPAFGINSPA